MGTDSKSILTRLREIEKDKTAWRENFTFVCVCLEAAETRPKAIWMVGEMCFAYPELLTESVFDQILSFLHSPDVLLCERAVCAIGRIGRSNGDVVKPYPNTEFIGSSYDDFSDIPD